MVWAYAPGSRVIDRVTRGCVSIDPGNRRRVAGAPRGALASAPVWLTDCQPSCWKSGVNRNLSESRVDCCLEASIATAAWPILHGFCAYAGGSDRELARGSG
jgi:hypothetical protein